MSNYSISGVSSGVSGAAHMSGAQSLGGRFGQGRSAVLSAVAGKLNLSVDQLRSQLASGKSLADVAQANGLSQQDLTSTVTSALQQANPPAGADVTTMASRMINHTGGHHHHHGGSGPAAATSSPMSATATSAAQAQQAALASSLLEGSTTDQNL